jgi:hypothetical protein
VRIAGEKAATLDFNWIFILAAKSGLAVTQSQHLIGSHHHTFQRFELDWTGRN